VRMGCGTSRAEAHHPAKQNAASQCHESRLLRPECAPMRECPENGGEFRFSPGLGSAHIRAGPAVGHDSHLPSRPEPLRLQQLTLDFHWHPACSISSCAMEKDWPMETVSPQRKTDKGRHDGCFRCLLVLLLIAVVPLGGCLYRSRPVAVHASTAQLQTATGSDLIERINAEATEIQTLNATVGITASVGGSKLGKITEYQEIRGYFWPASLPRSE